MTNEDKLSMVLTLGEWNVVLGILQRQPYDVVAVIIQKLASQAQQQPQSGSYIFPANGVDGTKTVGRE